uniref:Uncharacterized protein n=1 Tax=Caenorhabditis tropicalis TaxID=1561998 RepID=A0A1I7TJH4_9PELO
MQNVGKKEEEEEKRMSDWKRIKENDGNDMRDGDGADGRTRRLDDDALLVASRLPSGNLLGTAYYPPSFENFLEEEGEEGKYS